MLAVAMTFMVLVSSSRAIGMTTSAQHGSQLKTDAGAGSTISYGGVTLSTCAIGTNGFWLGQDFQINRGVSAEAGGKVGFNTITSANGTLCLDVENSGIEAGTGVHLYTCMGVGDKPHQNNQGWTLEASTGYLKANMSGLCLAFVTARGSPQPELQPCGANTSFTPEPAGRAESVQLKEAASGLCLASTLPSGIPPGVQACPAGSTQLWCDVSRTPEARAAALVKEMTREEKACWFDTVSCAVPRLNISAFKWWHEALHGLWSQDNDYAGSVAHPTTVFPAAIGMAGSFNRSLLHDVGDVIGTEARSLTSPFADGTFWAPNVRCPMT